MARDKKHARQGKKRRDSSDSDSEKDVKRAKNASDSDSDSDSGPEDVSILYTSDKCCIANYSIPLV